MQRTNNKQTQTYKLNISLIIKTDLLERYLQIKKLTQFKNNNIQDEQNYAQLQQFKTQHEQGKPTLNSNHVFNVLLYLPEDKYPQEKIQEILKDQKVMLEIIMNKNNYWNKFQGYIQYCFKNENGKGDFKDRINKLEENRLNFNNPKGIDDIILFWQIIKDHGDLTKCNFFTQKKNIDVKLIRNQHLVQ